MKYFVEAYYADDTIILGNGDGQTVLSCVDPRRTKWFKALSSGRNRPLFSRVSHWKIVDPNGNKVLHVIRNPHWTK